MNDDRQPERKPQWKECKLIVEELDSLPDLKALPLAVSISKSDHFRPRYSIQVGMMRPDKTMQRNISMFIYGQGKVNLRVVHQRIFDLLVKAEEWVHNEAQLWEDGHIELQQAREKKRDRPVKEISGLGKLGAKFDKRDKQST